MPRKHILKCISVCIYIKQSGVHSNFLCSHTKFREKGLSFFHKTLCENIEYLRVLLGTFFCNFKDLKKYFFFYVMDASSPMSQDTMFHTNPQLCISKILFTKIHISLQLL
jgi:hypothetical protein